MWFNFSTTTASSWGDTSCSSSVEKQRTAFIVAAKVLFSDFLFACFLAPHNHLFIIRLPRKRPCFLHFLCNHPRFFLFCPVILYLVISFCVHFLRFSRCRYLCALADHILSAKFRGISAMRILFCASLDSKESQPISPCTTAYLLS